MIFFNIFLVALSILIFYTLNNKSFVKINYLSFLFYNYILYGILGSFIIYFGFVDNTYFVEPIAKNLEVKTYGVFLIVYGLFGMLLGMLLIQLMFNKNRISYQWDSYINKEIIFSKFKLNMIILTILVVFSSAYYLYMIHPSPLLMALSGNDSLSIAIRRNEVTEHFSGIGIIKTISIVFSQILMYFLFAYYFIYKKYKIFIFIIFILVSILLLSNIEKATLMNMFFGLFLLYYYIKGILNLKKIFYFLSSIIILLIIMYLFIMGTELNEIGFKIFERLAIGQAIAPFLAIDYYTNHEFIYFNSMESSLFQLFLDSKVSRSSEIFMEYYYPGMKEMGGWNVNGIYIHEAYSNFGLFGVLLGPIFVGISNGILINIFLNLKKSALNLSFFTFFSVNIVSILTSFNAQIINTQSIMVVMFLILFYLINRRFY